MKLLIRGDEYFLPQGITKKIEMNKQNIMVKTKFENKRMLFSELCASRLIILPYRVMPSTIPVSYFEPLFLSESLVVTTDIPGFREHVCSYLGKTIPGTYRCRDPAEYLTFPLNSTKDIKYLKLKQLNYTKSLKSRIQNN
ncbi:MAG: hypothetical protein QXY55_05355 [Candidatus Korarchaeota archaeon]